VNKGKSVARASLLNQWICVPAFTTRWDSFLSHSS